MFFPLCFFISNLAFAEDENIAPFAPLPHLNELLKLPPQLSLEMSYVAEPMMNLSDPRLNYAHGIELMMQMSTGFGHEDPTSWNEFDHWIATFDLQQYSDTGDFGTEIGVVNPPQEIFNPSGLYMGEISFTRNPGDDWLYVKVGALSIDADFLSPEVTGMYTHASFNNQYNVSMEIFPISPMNAFGTVLGAQLKNGMMLKTGVYQLSSVQTNFDTRGWEWGVTSSDGLVEFVQLEGGIGASEESLSVCPPDDHTFSRHSKKCGDSDHVINELPAGSWQLGGFLSQSAQSSEAREGNHGVYGNITVPLSLGVGAGHRLWMSGAYGLHSARNPVPLWIGAGMVSQGILEARPLDLLLLGVSWSQFSFDDWAQRERLLEMEYSIVLTDTMVVLPNIQWYLPEEGGVNSGPIVAGLGVHFGL